MKKILLVDDEPRVIEQLRRLLAPMQQEWQVVFAQSGQDALAALAKDPCDVVITDMGMPGMDGAQFLAEVRARHPHVIRMVFSEGTDQKAVLQSAGSAHQYLAKTCALEQFRATVERTYAVQSLLTDESLRKLVSGMQTLPSLPTLYREVMEELQSPDASIQRLGQIIGKDLGMVMKILQLVNSPFYGLPAPISNAAQAVALLGLDTVKSLVLSMKVFAQFEGAKQSCFSLEVLWNHGMMTGRYARTIAKEQGAEQRVVEDAFTAGLLHDVGLLVLATNRPDQYTEVLALTQHSALQEWEAERQVLGATHADIAGYLLGIWGLSDTVVEAVAFHHEPQRSFGCTFSPLTVVHIANILEEGEQAAGLGEPPVGPDEQYLEACGVPTQLSIWQNHWRQLAFSRDGG